VSVKKVLFLVIWIVVFLPVAASWARPHDGEVFSLLQPDGARVDVKVFGDEFYQRVESMDGLTLIRDHETAWICYADVEPGQGKMPLVSDFVITNRRWHRIACVWDGAFRLLYADGALVKADDIP